MDIFQSIILGIIEGFTEFLPVSSTGHLIVASEWLGLSQNSENKAFEVIIQLASILAILLNFKDKFNFTKILSNNSKNANIPDLITIGLFNKFLQLLSVVAIFIPIFSLSKNFFNSIDKSKKDI